jgi:hypothetical protein
MISGSSLCECFGDDHPRKTPAIDDIRAMSINGTALLMPSFVTFIAETGNVGEISGHVRPKAKEVSNCACENKNIEGKGSPGSPHI